ncbi:MAG TPA: glycosyltransferase family 39 protein [Dehalococcoidia bacterium]|nr:glycosyltransferase family 39 protein [Dehalococcoidia bacterium]
MSIRTLPQDLVAFCEAHRRPVGALALLGSIFIFLVSVLPNLADHPTLTDDEMWVLSSAYKLAKEGVFGSDMFAGFYHADTHYYFNMPAHHVVIAAALKLLGYGVVQARLVGVVYGIATIVLVYVLARRLYGVAAAVLALALLLFLRLNIGFDTGLPLQESAANLRYDLAPVPFMLAAALLLLGPSTWRRAAAVGVLIGVATLLQFYGLFLLPVAAVFLWLEALPRQQRLRLVGALVGACALAGVPFGVYILAHFDDYKGQTGTVDQRDDFTSPRFFIDNLLNEPDRFLRPLAFKEIPKGEDPATVSPRYLDISEMATRRPSAKLAVLAGLPFAIAFAAWRALKADSRGDRLLALCLAGLVAQLALLESTKFFIYWIPVFPFLCIGVAGGVVWLLTPENWNRLRLAAAAFAVVALLLVFAEGSAARIGGLRTARDAASYDALAAQIHETVPAGSRVVGATSLWWAMRDTDYRSYFLFFYLTRPDSGPYKTTISGFLDDFDPDYLVMTQLADSELTNHLSPTDYEDWQRYLRDHAERIAHLEGGPARPYDYVDIWRIR